MDNLHEQIDEIREYTAALEAVLLSLCEELGLDPQALMEDIQTPERAAELKSKIMKLRTKFAKTGGSQRVADAHRKAEVQRHKEEKSKTVYGKGGKPAKKGSEDYKKGKQRERDLAAKRRNEAELHKKQKAKSAAWHKSQANNPEHQLQMAGYRNEAGRDGDTGESFMRAIGIRQSKGNPFR